MRSCWTLALMLILDGAARAETKAVSNPSPQAIEFFEKKVRPILVNQCLSCHGPDKPKVGLRLDSRAAVLKGSDYGPVVELGEPDKSLLIKAVRHVGDV